MKRLQLTDAELLKKRLLCEIIGKDGYFELMVLESSPSGNFVRIMRSNGITEWGAFPLIRVVEVLSDQTEFGQLSPCS